MDIQVGDLLVESKIGNADRIWDIVKSDLVKHYGEAAFTSWFGKIHLLEATQHRLLLAVPTNFMRDWIKSNYLPTIMQLCSHYDSAISEVEIITVDKLPALVSPILEKIEYL